MRKMFVSAIAVIVLLAVTPSTANACGNHFRYDRVRQTTTNASSSYSNYRNRHYRIGQNWSCHRQMDKTSKVIIASAVVISLLTTHHHHHR